ncbi:MULTISPECIES: heme o synthase [unclassified Wenzhouxiangella]|uniref:heme o synthase n=1 Tax=unclassified Wenzhouxiangella TaxID=2613841 RepID=UPI000E32CFF0|nr:MULTISPECIES: heme o synthase [unclassified Wenzhouxiangella]RFF27371.1 protoheme IX farnesyltransferase [Wenzhouxiangella sp. 15181]RFP68799.1 protoheme IX farnesyltransferase [Wenzhouxiangella sp. 15190]
MARQHAQTQTLPAVAPDVARPRPGLLSIALTLFKVRIGSAITLSALGGAVLAGGGWPAAADTIILALSVLLAASGAGAFNHYWDRDIDAVMGRTRKRPFVNGTLEAHTGWPVAFLAMIAAGSILGGWWFNPASGLFVAAGALTYALVYTVWLKRRNDWNIVIGGAAGSWAVLAGAAATGRIADPDVMLLAAVLFLWTPSHFWSLAIVIAEDYRRAGVPMLPVTRGINTAVRWNLINTAMLVTATLWLTARSGSMLVWLLAGTGAAWLAWTTLLMAREPSAPRAMTAFKASLIQLGLLLAGLFAMHAVP